MCVAVTGQVIEINGNYAKVDVMGNICNVYASLVNPRIGDYLLIHAGCAIETVKPELNNELNSLYKELYDCFP